ncbi:unnamed protein product [Haemonchus placei]|uniref:Rho-GAP domain-containing protein n=1 Tax=Haemonchus placei TaxID=6290 RepID=A0A0N4VSD7_HAEPC|nr:unnamed protein product [Haemonchus placei]
MMKKPKLMNYLEAVFPPVPSHDVTALVPLCLHQFPHGNEEKIEHAQAVAVTWEPTNQFNRVSPMEVIVWLG